MKNIVIGSVVAAVVVFVYQAMSWMVLGVHSNTLKYSAQQDAVLAALSQNLSEDGVYAIPNVPPGTSAEKEEEFSKSLVGKPAAVVHFQSRYSMNMGTQMLFGFIIDLIAAFSVAYVMWTVREKLPGFGSKLALAIAFAGFTILQSSLMMANWWNTPGHYLSGEIIDHVVGWGLGGAWLAWWMGRSTTSS
jgi:hypothetical protein